MAKQPAGKNQSAKKTHEDLAGLPIPFVTRKAPVLLAMRVLTVFFGLEAIYIFLRVITPITEGGPSFDSFEAFLIVAALQLSLVIWLILHWTFETYEIHKDDLHHNKGILFRHEETYPFNNMQSITCDQSPLGRIYHYGNIRLFIPTLGHELVLTQIPHPHHFIQTVRHVLPYPDKQRFILHG